MRLVTLVVLAACGQTATVVPRDDVPPPKPEPVVVVPDAAAPDPDAPPAMRHANAVTRDKLGTAEALPQHGLLAHAWGLGGESVVTIDADASTVRMTTKLLGQKPTDKTKKLDAAKLAKLVELGTAAWLETPLGPMPIATDVRNDLYVLDGDEGFWLSGNPIGGNATTGRPAAGAAFAAIYQAAGR